MISAKIIADSISFNGDRLTTFELEYPRFFHSEFMTHRLFSRNAASSRAIPVQKMINQVMEEPAMPVFWGINEAGMQATEEHPDTELCVKLWKDAAKSAVASAMLLKEQKLHKQLVNRVLEPFQVMKTIVTATEYDNFFWLRCHEDAQPEIKALADMMYCEHLKNTPQQLGYKEWHLPYIFTANGQYFSTDEHNRTKGELSLEEAQKVSASCCAQVSYRKLDDSLEKAIRIYDQLVTTMPVHASPLEHIATPVSTVMEKGVTHVDTDYNMWSGNFKGWIQYRQLVNDNACWDFKKQ